jgi:phosphatidylserine decarboxylase
MRLPFTPYGAADLAISTVACLGAIGACAWFAPAAPWLWAPAGVALVVWLLLLNFFRDPERTVPKGRLHLVAPADGVVQDLADVDEPRFLGGAASRLGIFLSPLDVHVNRMPTDCVVAEVDYRKGKMLKAFDPRAVTENESCAVGIEALDGKARMIVRQVTGAVARRIVCPVKPGDRLGQGERYGMIKFGSRTELWVPRSLGVRWNVKVGDRVVGGVTVVGTIEEPATR